MALKEILKNASITKTNPDTTEFVDKAEFYEDGFSGKPESAELRKILAKELNLPIRISANAMLDIINKTIGRGKYKAAVNKINQTKNIK